MAPQESKKWGWFLKRIAFVLALFTFNSAFADDPQYQSYGLYDKCIFSYDMGDLYQDNVLVKPIGPYCYNLCETECGAYSRLSNGVTGYELNGDIISNCKKECRKGVLYNPSQVRTSAGTQLVGPIGSTCSTDPSNKLSAAYNIFKTTINVSAGDKVTFNVRSLSGKIRGSIYMCGSDSITIFPIFAKMTAAEWDANSSWRSMGSTPGAWSARNYWPTNTGIDIKDGDYLDISYYTNLKLAPSFANQEPRLLIRKPNFNSWYNGNPFTFNAFDTLPGDALQFDTRQLAPNSPTSGKCVTNRTSNTLAIQENNSQVAWNGLKGYASTAYADDCDVVGVKSVHFSGYLSGWSQRFSRLGITHFDNAPGFVWADNVGGATVSIARYGCPYHHGELLQYANPGTKSTTVPGYEPTVTQIPPVETDWIDISVSQLENIDEITMSKDGAIYLRIKPLNFDHSVMPSCGRFDSVCQDSITRVQKLYGIENRDGEYLVTATRIKDANSLFSPISNIINKIRVYLYGSGITGDQSGHQGTVQYLFTHFVTDTTFMTMIRSLLVFYIAYTGLSYALGIAQITQKDGLKRIFAISMVLILLSPNSWTFFGTYLFRLFVDGGVELMANMVNYKDYNISSTRQAEVFQTPDKVFEIFDAPIRIIFSQTTWFKLLALAVSTLLGWAFVLAVLIAGILYTIAIIQAMLIYTVSLIIMGFLLLLAPIFISFVLFEYTRKLFMAWLEQLITVTLQPVFMIAAIGMFTTLLILGLKVALSFSVCEACLLRFYLPSIVDKCIIQSFHTIYSLHLPDSANLSAPITSLAAIFYVLILAQAMYVFVPFMVELTNNLVGFGFYGGVNMAGYGSISAYGKSIGMAKQGIQFALGTSDSVTNRAFKIHKYTTKPLVGTTKEMGADMAKSFNKAKGKK